MSSFVPYKASSKLYVDQDALPPVKDVVIPTLTRPRLSRDTAVDLSGMRAVLHPPPGSQSGTADPDSLPMISYWREHVSLADGTRALTYLPFPPNTVGHFFYHISRVAPVAGSVQFRLMSSDDDDPMSGNRILRNEYGTPWEIPLLAIASEPRLKALKEMLLENKHVPEQLMEYCADYATRWHFTVGAFSQIIFHKLQPFYIDLASKYQQLIIAGPSRMWFWRPRMLLYGEHKPHTRFSSGRLLCNMTSDGCIRVLEITEPLAPIEGDSIDDFSMKPHTRIHRSGRPLEIRRQETWSKSRFHWAWSWDLYRREFPDYWAPGQRD